MSSARAGVDVTPARVPFQAIATDLPAPQDSLWGPRLSGDPPLAEPMPYGDAKPAECTAWVIRRGRDGTATAEIDMGQNVKRRVLFVAGKVVATDSMQTFTTTRRDDITTVKFENGEFYEIVEALVTGG